MPISFYARLIALTAGALLYLFLLALIVGHRRPRRLERVLFFLVLALFLFYAGALLAMNAGIHYISPPAATQMFANGLILVGLALIPGLLVHAEVERAALARRGATIPAFLKLGVVAFYLPAIYFAWKVLPALISSPGLEFLWVRGRGAGFYGAWLGLALAAGAAIEARAGRGAVTSDKVHKYLIVTLSLLAVIVLLTYGLGFPREPLSFSYLATVLLFVGAAPGVVLGYFAVRHNFLEIGMQRNLIYAISAALLALLYLALVRRLSGWFEPILPPEATAAILLFLLVFTFEPLERVIGRALYRSFQERMGQTQKLVMELQAEAQSGDLAKFISGAERRICEELGLAAVRVSIPAPPGAVRLQAPGGLGHRVELPLKSHGSQIGLLEACSTGAVLVGEATVALEFLAEQIPTLINHCRLIQEKVQLERELAERERLALVGQMAASISHNLRNPLGSMKTVIQVLLEDQGLAPRVRQDCELVVQEIERLSKKLTQLLQYAKPGVRAEEHAHSVDLVPLTEQIVSLLRHESEKRGARLRFEAGAKDLLVRVSEEAWRDAISNLVVNAIEAQRPGGSVSVEIAACGSAAKVEISDDGPGIPADVRARIFQPFFTTKASGTGLGLAIASRRVGEMGGEIRCESPVTNGHGTKFTILVPLQSAPEAANRSSEKGSAVL